VLLLRRQLLVVVRGGLVARARKRLDLVAQR
jgi:hypothetical protein